MDIVVGVHRGYQPFREEEDVSEKMSLRSLENEREEQAWDSAVHYAFSPDKTEEDWRALVDALPPMPFMAKRGYFHGDRLVSACGLLPMRLRHRGKLLPAGGITEVATPPEYRRKGYCRDMLCALLHEMKDRGLSTSVLWPFSSAFYETLGWAPCAETSGFTFRVEDMRKLTEGFARDSRGRGEFVKASEEDIETLNQVYSTWAEQYDLTVDRDPDWWRSIILAQWGRASHFYLYRDSSGEPAGYVGYLIKDRGNWERTLRLIDMAYRDLDAYKALLHFLFIHDSQVIEYHVEVPAGDPLFDLHVTGKVRRYRGVMFRIVDAERALRALEMSALPRGSLVIELEDPFLGCNDGLFQVTTGEGEPGVERVRGGDPDVSMSVNALAQLYSGYRTPEQLAGAESLRSNSADSLHLLSRVFPRRETALVEEF